MLASASRQELARQVHYLKTENQILRSRLPGRVLVTPSERRRLVKPGRGLGKVIKELVAIVQPASFLKWLNADDNAEVDEEAVHEEAWASQDAGRGPTTGGPNRHRE